MWYLFLIMFTLKLCGIITVSWWIVTLPLTGAVALALILTGLGISLKHKK